MAKVALLMSKIGTVDVQNRHCSSAKVALFTVIPKIGYVFGFRKHETYILIPKVHENIEKYENQIRY